MKTCRFPVRATAIVLLAAWALWVEGAPMMPNKRALPEEAYTLANLRQFALSVPNISSFMENQGYHTARIEQMLREHLEEHGFEVVKDASAPEVVVQINANLHEDHEDVVALALVLAVHQDVELTRLGQHYKVPTASMSQVVLAEKASLEEHVRDMARVSIEGLAMVVRRASVAG